VIEAGESPKLSLVVATVGRTAELVRLLDSLTKQTRSDFEVIIVDQNEDGRLDAIISSFMPRLTILRLRSARGLSRARNQGLRWCRGEIIGMPDDDCWYPPALLQTVCDTFAIKSGCGYVVGQWLDEEGAPLSRTFRDSSRWMSSLDLWLKGFSICVFLKAEVVSRIGYFDERLGVGAQTSWGSGEETDYLIRIANADYKGWYEPSCIVYHPRVVRAFDERAIERALSYGRGTGFVLRKHSVGLVMLLRFVLRPFGGVLLGIATLRWSKARFYWSVLRGRVEGWMDAEHEAANNI